MSNTLLDCCPECNESRKYKFLQTEYWLTCKTCGYTEDSFKGPVSETSRKVDPQGSLIQYL